MLSACCLKKTKGGTIRAIYIGVPGIYIHISLVNRRVLLDLLVGKKAAKSFFGRLLGFAMYSKKTKTLSNRYFKKCLRTSTDVDFIENK